MFPFIQTAQFVGDIYIIEFKYKEKLVLSKTILSSTWLLPPLFAKGELMNWSGIPILELGNALKNTLAQLEKEWAKLSTMDLSKMITLDSSQQQRIQQINNTFKELGNKLKTEIERNLKNITTQISQLTTASSKKAGTEITQLLQAGK